MNSFIGWVGGKRALRKTICERFPDKIEKYVEVFGGAAWVLFCKDKHAPCEVYNDINSQLVNLFRCVKYHPEAIALEMECLLNSREIFNYYKRQSVDGLTDIQKAARYLYLIKTSYGSNLDTFGGKSRKINRFEILGDIQKRLEMVLIENKSYDMLIKQYDRDNTLFYCDPPYKDAECLYDMGDSIFDEGQHIKLNSILSNIKGKFLLSYNDNAFIRNLYKDFFIEECDRHNNLTSRYDENKVYRELIIRNY